MYYFITSRKTNSAGDVVWKADYLPFGEILANEDPDGDGIDVENNFRFPGQYYDSETGLHYNWFRYYNPELGRYMRPDKINLGTGQSIFKMFVDKKLRVPFRMSDTGEGFVINISDRTNEELWNLVFKYFGLPSLELIITNPTWQNLYTYVIDNPPIYSDRDGNLIDPVTAGLVCLIPVAAGLATWFIHHLYTTPKCANDPNHPKCRPPEVPGTKWSPTSTPSPGPPPIGGK